MHKFSIYLQLNFAFNAFDAVGWAAERASGLQKTELWGGGKVISGRFRDLAMSVQ